MVFNFIKMLCCILPSMTFLKFFSQHLVTKTHLCCYMWVQVINFHFCVITGWANTSQWLWAVLLLSPHVFVSCLFVCFCYYQSVPSVLQTFLNMSPGKHLCFWFLLGICLSEIVEYQSGSWQEGTRSNCVIEESLIKELLRDNEACQHQQGQGAITIPISEEARSCSCGRGLPNSSSFQQKSDNQQPGTEGADLTKTLTSLSTLLSSVL